VVGASHIPPGAFPASRNRRNASLHHVGQGRIIQITAVSLPTQSSFAKLFARRCGASHVGAVLRSEGPLQRANDSTSTPIPKAQTWIFKETWSPSARASLLLRQSPFSFLALEFAAQKGIITLAVQLSTTTSEGLSSYNLAHIVILTMKKPSGEPLNEGSRDTDESGALSFSI
jgi:hypothetical protein